jgi:hypothetical protein
LRPRPCSINQPRDPRWGRLMETPGESSILNGAFGTGYTLGIQTGADPRFINVAVTLKHWDAVREAGGGGAAPAESRYRLHCCTVPS